MRFPHIFPFLTAIAALAVSCGGNSPADPEPVVKELTHEQQFDGTYYHDVPRDGWEKETRARADLMLDIAWTPLKKMPMTGVKPGVFFEQGTGYNGIPYSSVSDTKGNVGRDLSFHTFLSAVADPMSLIYSVDYREGSDQYNHRATFYGTQCSASTQYVWGVPIYQTSGTIYHGKAAHIRKLDTQDMQDLELFDGIIYYSDEVGDGHMMMVYDILRDKSGKICKLVIFEGAHPTTRITTYTPQEYRERLDKQKGESFFYRLDRTNYAYLLRVPSYVENSLDEVDHALPTSLCPDRGDKVSYAAGDPVTIDILAGGYSALELYKDDALYGTYPLSGDTMTFSDLPVGLYKACLASDGRKSEFTFFEIGDVTFTPEFDGKTLTINCNGNTSEPLYITINDSEGSTIRFVRKAAPGKWAHDGDTGTATHCRVHFGGKYSSYKGSSIRFKK